jgi:hypothetical protein
MSIEAMKQALEALESINEISKPPMNIPLAAEIDGAMDALRQAIEQAEQWDTSDMAHRSGGLAIDDDDIQEYKRPWVGLTDKEKNDCLVEADPCETLATPEAQELMRSVETKLKERNT